MTTGALFSQNVGKLFSELKLVTDNLLFIYAEANWEATENSFTAEISYGEKGASRPPYSAVRYAPANCTLYTRAQISTLLPIFFNLWTHPRLQCSCGTSVKLNDTEVSPPLPIRVKM